MIDLEERLRGLADQPVEAPAPLERLERRARVLRRRRLGGYVAAAILVAAVGAIALPLVVPSGHLTVLTPADRDPTPAPTDAGLEEPAGEPDPAPAVPPAPAAPGVSEAPPDSDPTFLSEPDGGTTDRPSDDEPDTAQPEQHPSAAAWSPGAELRMARSMVLPGDQVAFAAVNTGDVLLMYDARYRIDRWTGSSWSDVGPTGASWPDWVRELEPGGRDDTLSMSAEGLMPGTYRLVKLFQAETYVEHTDASSPIGPGVFEAWVRFTVIAPMAGD